MFDFLETQLVYGSFEHPKLIAAFGSTSNSDEYRVTLERLDRARGRWESGPPPETHFSCEQPQALALLRLLDRTIQINLDPSNTDPPHEPWPAPLPQFGHQHEMHQALFQAIEYACDEDEALERMFPVRRLCPGRLSPHEFQQVLPVIRALCEFIKWHHALQTPLAEAQLPPIPKDNPDVL